MTAALTPRHEAPADDGPVFHMNLLSHEDNEAWLESARRVAAKHEAPGEDEARRKLIQCIEQWDGETEYDADDLASLADGILHAFNGPPVVSPAAADELSSNPCQLEAPAEGAGEREALAAIMHRNMIPDEDGGFSFHDLKAADQIMDYLRARSSAPEAREGEVCPNGHQPGCDCDVAEEDVARSKPSPAAPSADKLREDK